VNETKVSVPPIDVGRVLRSPPALSALRWLVSQRRAAASNVPEASTTAAVTALDTFVSGKHAPAGAVERSMGTGRLQALLDVDAASIRADRAIPGLALKFLRGLAVAVPVLQLEDGQEVYFGTEGPWLIEMAWRLGPPNGTAADLATGTGIVAAALSARYERVVATDVSLPAVQTAALTLALNRSPVSHTTACVSDVCAGLRPHSYDLVVANPPWVPDLPSNTDEQRVLYAHGGPTGMELPSRFVRHGADLLTPGGTAIIIVNDTTWEDGRRPLNNEIDYLRSLGFEVSIDKAPEFAWGPKEEQDTIDSIEGCVAAQLVGLVFSRGTEA